MSRISSQQIQLEAVLLENGWRIIDRTTAGLEWWADEIWAIESERRPCGLKAYLTFLTDPMSFSHNRKRGEGVWAVLCTAKIAASPNEPEPIAEISLNHWNENVNVVATKLGQFRDGAAAS